jgi:hypothetical protein
MSGSFAQRGIIRSGSGRSASECRGDGLEQAVDICFGMRLEQAQSAFRSEAKFFETRTDLSLTKMA